MLRITYNLDVNEYFNTITQAMVRYNELIQRSDVFHVVLYNDVAIIAMLDKRNPLLQTSKPVVYNIIN